MTDARHAVPGRHAIPVHAAVIPAKAGIHVFRHLLDSRLRGNDF
jgi:hypothetical protein